MVIFHCYVSLPEGRRSGLGHSNRVFWWSVLCGKKMSGEVFGWQLESAANLAELGTQMICKMGRMIVKHPKTSKNMNWNALFRYSLRSIRTRADDYQWMNIFIMGGDLATSGFGTAALAFGGVQQCPTQTLVFLALKTFQRWTMPNLNTWGFYKKTVSNYWRICFWVLYWVHWTATLITWVRFLFRQNLSMMF